ncbi:NACHT domain-containing protein [Hymenobacter defluvii]|uniref:AAA+ ATPase domain-containing protein n=1 Tax=Hymenobacter defluvii TaxID=2054411 RepID=A0ABS3TAV4_9BACT|nr:hypothetical protein [Hymenobacter defluvii]MBO3270787.1 hypothetical protein [Hymenobacter defluvii]
MPEYNFERLSDKEFERLATALCAEYIIPGLRIYGSGTDGGREAIYEGKMNYPSVASPWDGYLVVQCKQKQSRGATPKEEGQWALSQLNAEMEKYKTAKKTRRIPDYLLFITNAQLSAQLKTGGKDKFAKQLDIWAQELGIKGVDFWDRDKLSNLLDSQQKIAQRFGMLHDGDLLHYAAQAALADRDEIETTLSMFLQEELRADQYVNLAQAGHTNDDRTPLARVFVDLHAVNQNDRGRSFFVVNTVQSESDRPIYPTLLEQERRAIEEEQRRIEEAQDAVSETKYAIDENDLSEDDDIEDTEVLSPEEIAELEEMQSHLPEFPVWRDSSRFVIIGGPGQGKSTLAQQLAQRHRAALLRANATRKIDVETERILRIIEDAATESGIGLPNHPRWPFRVILEQFADKLATGEVTSVLEYISFLVRRRTKREFTRRDAEQLLATTPWFVAFDGLDEVPAVSNRLDVLDAVRRFLLEAQDKDADLLVIATTRPQGYEGDFGESRFNHLILRTFSREEALAYAKKFVETKYANEQDRQERIMHRLETAAQEEAIVRLMQTPLQVTIMSALVDLVGNPPRERYVLFNRYYEIIYQREQERGLKLSDVLARYRSGIEILHDRIGLLLQIEAESVGKSQSRITRARLESLVHNYLVTEELEGEALMRTKADFMDVALHRLVFIVPLEDERYGFEVRSLQEFSAARALMRGEYSVIKNRLRRIATIPYWRNTMLFAVGRAFAEQNEPLCDMITHLCWELNDDTENILFYRTLAGSRLAADILEDGVVEWRPRYRRLFYETLLRLLHLPQLQSATRLAKLYTVNDENRYNEAVYATTSNSIGVPYGVLITLGVLVHRGRGPAWSKQLFQRFWPTDLEDEQAILEQVYKWLSWDDWTIERITQVARVSDIDWVIQNLDKNYTPIKWIRDAQIINQMRTADILFSGKKPILAYQMKSMFVKEEVLDRIQKADPIHPSWLLLTAGRNFLLNPTPESLAEIIEITAEKGHLLETSNLPWQLASVLSGSDTTEELLHHAQRARKGELGTVKDWKEAESRLESKGFTIDDLCAISDAEWPFTADIARVGMQPTGNFRLFDRVDPGNETLLLLLEAFNKMTSNRYKHSIAGNIFFIAGYTYESDITLRIPLDTIKILSINTNWYVHINYILSMIDLDIDYIAEVETLDIIGSRISTLDNFEDVLKPISHKRQAVAENLVPILGKKKVREGILRFIASLVVTGAEVDIPLIDVDTLSTSGRVAYAAINLYSNNPKLNIDSLSQLVLDVWTYKNPQTGLEDMPRIMHSLLETAPLSGYVIEVLEKIYPSNIIGMKMKAKLMDAFITQFQYHNSALNNPAFEKELSMSWLFELNN